MQTKSWKIPNPHFSDYLCCFGLPAIPNGPKWPIWAYLGQIWPIPENPTYFRTNPAYFELTLPTSNQPYLLRSNPTYLLCNPTWLPGRAGKSTGTYFRPTYLPYKVAWLLRRVPWSKVGWVGRWPTLPTWGQGALPRDQLYPGFGQRAFFAF
mgnify:CR=1 FL=1